MWDDKQLIMFQRLDEMGTVFWFGFLDVGKSVSEVVFFFV